MAFNSPKTCDICGNEYKEWRYEANQAGDPVMVVPIQMSDKCHRLVISVSYSNQKENICKECFVTAMKNWLSENQ